MLCGLARTIPSIRGRNRLHGAGTRSIVWLAFALGVSATAQARGQDGPTIGGQSLGNWVAALRGDDPRTRHTAVFAIGLLGPDAKQAVPALAAALDDPREDVRKGAAKALIEIGPDAAPAVPALVLKLGDLGFVDGGGFRGAGATHLAADALIAIGPPAVPALIDALGSKSEDVRDRAAITLGRIGPAAREAGPAIVRMIKAQGVPEGCRAVKALDRIDPAAVTEVFPTLLAAYDALKPEDESGPWVLDCLRKIGAPPSPGLIRQLDDPDPDRRAQAAILIGMFGRAARPAVGPLRAALGDLSRRVRVEAAAALLEVDPANTRALPILLLALDSTDLGLLDTAIPTVTDCGPRAAAAIPKLRKIVDRNDMTHETMEGADLEWMIASVKIRAAGALVAVSPDPGEGVSALLAQFRLGENAAPIAALEALGELGPRAASAVSALAGVAKDPASHSAYRALKALERIDPQHEAIVPALIGLLSNPGSVTVGQEKDVITTLGLMGPGALPAVPALVGVLKDKHEASGKFDGPAVLAAKALGRIGPATREAVSALVDAMRTEHDVRMAAAEALVSMGTAASPAIPDLIAMLGAEETRPWAAEVLGAIGPEATAAVPALIRALSDGNPFVVADVGSALLRIDPTERAVVEARLIPLRNRGYLYASAVLSGALGRRSPEAIGLTRQTLRGINAELARLDPARAKDDEDWGPNPLDVIENHLEYMATLGAGAAEAIPRLTVLTHHADPRIRRSATIALRRIDTR